jgi:4-amino-4-deoxy-L-arabinose transferase-like glycosyltransferase
VFGRDARLPSARFSGPVLALLVITLAGAALRVWLIDARPLIGDEALTWRTSGRPLPDFLLWRHHGDHPPLSFVLVRLSLEAFGRSVWSLRSPSAIAGILCIPMAWLLGRRFGAGLLLATLVAFDPVLVVLSSLARMYALLALLILAALSRMDALVARDERRAGPWLGLGAILLAATWTHYLGFALAAAILGTLAWRSGLRAAFLVAIPPLAGTLPPLARAVRLLYLDRPTPLDRLRPVATSATSGTLDGWEAVRFVIERAADHWPIGVAAPLLTLAGLVGVARLARRSAPLAQAVAALAVLTLVAVIAGAPGRPFGVDRYLVPWRLAVSIGLAALALLPGRRVRAGVTAGAALLAVGGIRAASPRAELPGVFAIGALSRSLVAEIEADEVVAFEQPYLLSLGTWYGLPVESVGPGFPRRSDGSLPARTWLLVTGRTDAPTVPGLGSDRGRYRLPAEDLKPVLEAAYGARVDREDLDRALRASGAVAIAFAPGAAALRAPAP